MLTLKVRNAGRDIENLPDLTILRDRRAPAAVGRALDAWESSEVETRAAAAPHARAERAAEKSTLLVPGERDRWLAEVTSKVTNEASVLHSARRARIVAAQALVATLEEHAERLDAIAARLALRAHADKVDALLDEHDARERLARLTEGLFVGRHPLRPEWSSALGETRSFDPLEESDKVDTHGLAAIAGDRCGLVEAEAQTGQSAGVRVLTTPRRAAMLAAESGGVHGSRWALVTEEEILA